MDLADSDSLSRVESYSGTGSSAFPFGVRDYHTLWSFFPELFRLGTRFLNTGPTTPKGRVPRFGLFRFRSPLLTESLLLSFPGGNEMFQFPPFASCTYEFSARSIRESRDQFAFDQSPGLIAVFHALHRLLAPRHPPHALSNLAALIFLFQAVGLTEGRAIRLFDPYLHRRFGSTRYAASRGT